MKTQNVDEPRGAYQIASLVTPLLLAIMTFLPWDADAQQPAALTAQSAAGPTQKAGRILIPVTLTAALDSKRRKPGDEVIAKTAVAVHLIDGTVIPRGEKVVGHVTEAKSRSKGDIESTLGITFDKVNLAEGKFLAIRGAIQAIAPSLGESAVGGVGYSDLNQTVEHTVGGVSGAEPVPLLDEQSEGVYGFKNLQLSPDGVLKSGGKTVKLEFGSQVMVRAMVGG